MTDSKQWTQQQDIQYEIIYESCSLEWCILIELYPPGIRYSTDHQNEIRRVVQDLLCWGWLQFYNTVTVTTSAKPERSRVYILVRRTTRSEQGTWQELPIYKNSLHIFEAINSVTRYPICKGLLILCSGVMYFDKNV